MSADRSLLSESQLRVIAEVEPEGRRLAGTAVKFQDWESNAGPLVAAREKPVRRSSLSYVVPADVNP